MRQRPDWKSYYMQIAMTVRTRANCLGSRVGAILVQNDRIIATGYNGTPHGVPNCSEGGCHRCSHRDEYVSGKDYDLCICVHAEQNTLLSAARFGIATEGAVLYSTMQPCFGCAKEIIQAKISAVYYVHPWVYPDAQFQQSYEDMLAYIPGGVNPLEMEDPDAEWAVSTRRRS